jgi:hypothetical protein
VVNHVKLHLIIRCRLESVSSFVALSLHLSWCRNTELSLMRISSWLEWRLSRLEACILGRLSVRGVASSFKHVAVVRERRCRQT